MLLSFTVENFRSIREKSTLVLSAASIKEHTESVYSVVSSANPRILKSACLIGPNAVGKSNLLKAIDSLCSLVTGNANLSDVAVPFKLIDGYNSKPVYFDIVFQIENSKYRYGVSILGKVIYEEYLFHVSSIKEESIFLRSDNSFAFGARIKRDLGTKLQLLSEMTRNDNLFISVLSNYNYDLAMAIQQWFSRVMFFKDSEVENWIQFTARLMSSDSQINSEINTFVKHADVGIEKLVERRSKSLKDSSYNKDFLHLIESLSSKDLEIDSLHRKFTSAFEYSDRSKEYFNLLNDESSGTIKLVSLIGPILYALKNRYILLVDEIDSRLHSHILKHLYEYFMLNSFALIGSQFIFTMHNPYLLKKNLRRDQIILFEKDHFGGTSFHSLHHKNPSVRNDASLEKDYLAGKYSAIPKIGSQLDLEF